jgi:hypothetical protein
MLDAHEILAAKSLRHPPGLAVVDPSNPQSWNRYAYVLNNPLAFDDPTGLVCNGVVQNMWDTLANGTGIFDEQDCASNGGTWSGGPGGSTGGDAGLGSSFLNGPGGGGPGHGFPGNPMPGCIATFDSNDNLGPWNCPPTGSGGPGAISGSSSGSANRWSIGPASLDVVNDYCSARGRAKFIADWVPGGQTIVRNFWGNSSLGEKLGFYQLSTPDINRITEEGSGGQTVALHTTSELLKEAAGSSLLLTRLRATTGIPKSVGGKILGRTALFLVALDATIGFYKEVQEIEACQAGN